MTNLFSTSDEAIKQKLCDSTRAHTETTTFDVDSLYVIVKTILNHSIKIAEEVILQGYPAQLATIEEKIPKPDFSAPLCTLKQIACQLSCGKALTGEITDKTTLSILEKLSNYPWSAKAVLTLAAFAMEFADFFLIAMLHQSVDQQLAKSLGTLKRVLTKHSELQKRRRAIVDLNVLIKLLLQVMETMFEWEKLSAYDPKGIPVVSKTVVAYWIVMTVVTCATKVTIVASDEDKAFDVSAYTNKLSDIDTKLKEQLKAYRMKKEEEDYYRKVMSVLKDPSNIVEVIKILFCTEVLIHGSTKQEIDVLSKKHVLLLISRLETIDLEISMNDENYKIVWVPIVEEWTDELKSSFESLSKKMPYHIIKLDTVTAGVTFIKREWAFKGEPMVVVMNPQGKVENHNAFHLIRLWGMKAFPFRRDDEKKVSSEVNWIDPVMNKFPDAKQLMGDEENYIFFYGGKTKLQKWNEEFKNKVEKIVQDSIIKNKNITIKWLDLGNMDPEEAKAFWSRVQSMFMLKLNQEETDPASTREIQKLFSNKKGDDGWAVLAKGSVAKIAGDGSTFLKVLEKFDEWKENVEKNKAFEVAFKDYYSKINMEQTSHCCRLDIPIVAGKAPEHMKCAECESPMEMFITYKCCKGD